jgi:hypothetical protein
MSQYEITLRYVGNNPPEYMEDEYGFGDNPPIIVNADSRKEALRMLRLPRRVRVKTCKKVS